MCLLLQPMTLFSDIVLILTCPSLNRVIADKNAFLPPPTPTTIDQTIRREFDCQRQRHPPYPSYNMNTFESNSTTDKGWAPRLRQQ